MFIFEIHIRAQAAKSEELGKWDMFCTMSCEMNDSQDKNESQWFYSEGILSVCSVSKRCSCLDY